MSGFFRGMILFTLKCFASSFMSMILAIPSIALIPMMPLSARLVARGRGPAKSSVDTVQHQQAWSMRYEDSSR